MKFIAILITVHNRKAKTLQCLTNVFALKIPVGFKIEVYLTNDGCSDGTPEAIKEYFPEVNIIDGDGNLYWCRGMYKAWQAAAAAKTFDFYLWLNDDTLLFNHSLLSVIKNIEDYNSNIIICGATQSDSDGTVTYSARTLSSNKLLVPNGILQECDLVNGNFLLVPKVVYDVLGNLDWTFRHAIGDFDYGLRAKQSGFKCYLAPIFVGICENNPTLPKWCLRSTPLWQRFKLLYSPLGYAEPIPFFIYEKRHFGLFVALKHFFSINLRALMPQLWES